MDENDRFIEVIEYLKNIGQVSNYVDVATILGTNKSGINDIKKSRKKIPIEVLKSMSISYPLINIEWILTGNGSMLKADEQPAAENKPVISYVRQGNPYYNVDFAAGFSLLINDQTINPDYYIDFSPFNEPGAIWCNATGDSMVPDILSGDKIVLKKINDPSVMPLGEIYGIVTDEFRTIKRVRKASDNDHWLLVPSNPNFDTQEIAKDKVRAIFKLLGAVRTF